MTESLIRDRNYLDPISKFVAPLAVNLSAHIDNSVLLADGAGNTSALLETVSVGNITAALQLLGFAILSHDKGTQTAPTNVNISVVVRDKTVQPVVTAAQVTTAFGAATITGAHAWSGGTDAYFATDADALGTIDYLVGGADDYGNTIIVGDEIVLDCILTITGVAPANQLTGTLDCSASAEVAIF